MKIFVRIPGEQGKQEMKGRERYIWKDGAIFGLSMGVLIGVCLYIVSRVISQLLGWA